MTPGPERASDWEKGEGEPELRRRGTFFIKIPGKGESGLIIPSVFVFLISRFFLLKRVS